MNNVSCQCADDDVIDELESIVMQFSDMQDYCEGILVTEDEAREFARQKVQEYIGRCPQIPKSADLYYKGKL